MCQHDTHAEQAADYLHLASSYHSTHEGDMVAVRASLLGIGHALLAIHTQIEAAADRARPTVHRMRRPPYDMADLAEAARRAS
jgi:hypothetical protein